MVCNISELCRGTLSGRMSASLSPEEFTARSISDMLVYSSSKEYLRTLASRVLFKQQSVWRLRGEYRFLPKRKTASVNGRLFAFGELLRSDCADTSLFVWHELIEEHIQRPVIRYVESPQILIDHASNHYFGYFPRKNIPPKISIFGPVRVS